jgi:hypothetical protein
MLDGEGADRFVIRKRRSVPFHLATVQSGDIESGQLALGIPLSRFRGKPECAGIVPGGRIELRRPDGSRSWVILLEVFVEGLTKVAYSSADEATLYCFPGDPLVRFVFSSFVTDTFAPIGTEVWLIDLVDFDG